MHPSVNPSGEDASLAQRMYLIRSNQASRIPETDPGPGLTRSARGRRRRAKLFQSSTWRAEANSPFRTNRRALRLGVSAAVGDRRGAAPESLSRPVKFPARHPPFSASLISAPAARRQEKARSRVSRSGLRRMGPRVGRSSPDLVPPQSSSFHRVREQAIGERRIAARLERSVVRRGVSPAGSARASERRLRSSWWIHLKYTSA